MSEGSIEHLFESIDLDLYAILNIYNTMEQFVVYETKNDTFLDKFKVLFLNVFILL